MMNEEVQEVAQTFEVLNRIPVGAMLIREDFVVLFWNKYLEEWTKLSKNEIVDQPIELHFPHIREPKYAIRLQQIFAGGPPTIFSSQLHKHFIQAPLPNGQLRILYDGFPNSSIESTGILCFGNSPRCD